MMPAGAVAEPIRTPDMLLGEPGPQSAPIGLAGKAALVLGASFVCIGLFAMGLDMPPITAAFAGRQQAWMVPWIGSIVPPAFALASLLAGSVVGRYASRPVYLASILLFALAGAAPFLIGNLYLILLLRIVLGVAVAGALSAALDGIAHLPAEERPTLFGLQTVVGSLTAVLLFPVVGVLTRHGWHAAFLIHLAGLGVLPLALCLPKAPRVRARAVAAGPGLWLAGVPLWMIGFALVLGLSMFVMQFVAPFYLIHIGIMDAATASIPLTAMAFTGMASAAGYGVVQRRLGTAGVFLLVSLLSFIGLTIAAFAPSLPVLTMGAMLLGASTSVCVSNIYVAASQCNPQAPARAMGVVNATLYLAPLLLPLTTNAVHAKMGAGGTFAVYAVLMLAFSPWFAVRVVRLRRGGEPPMMVAHQGR